MKKPILVFLAFLLVVMVAGGVAVLVNQHLKLSPEEKRAEVLQMLKEKGLVEVLSDGQYDETYLLMELRGTNRAELRKYWRPFEVLVTDKDGNQLAHILGTGMLAGEYVLSSPALFSFLLDPAVQEALAKEEISVAIRLSPDLKLDDNWKFERLKLYYLGNSAAVLQREKPFMFSSSAEFPFSRGSIRDLNINGKIDVLYGLGVMFLGGEEKSLHSYKGEVEFTLPETGAIVFAASLTPSDFGGPVFALRDGTPELLGFVVFVEGGKAVAFDLSTILKEIQEEAGLQINLKFKE